MIYILPLIIMLMWLASGQFCKGLRRFGIPSISTTVYILNKLFTDKDKNKKIKTRYKDYLGMFLYMLLMPFLLAMGYGENSAIYTFINKLIPVNPDDSVQDRHSKVDLTVRYVYGILLSIPMGIYLILTVPIGLALIKWGVIIVALMGAFLVRAGSLGKIGKYDILIEDIVRSLTFGCCMVFILI